MSANYFYTKMMTIHLGITYLSSRMRLLLKTGKNDGKMFNFP